MNYNNQNQYQKQEDPFSFLKGDDCDFNSSLKGLEDMYNNMMEPGVAQKKKDDEFRQKQQILNQVVQFNQNNPHVVMGVPVNEQPAMYQNQQYPVQFQQQVPQNQFNYQQQVKPFPQNQMQQQQYYYQQPIQGHIPITDVQFSQNVNYNYPQGHQNQFNNNHHY